MIVLGSPNYGGFSQWYCASLFRTACAIGSFIEYRSKVTPYIGEARDWLCAQVLAGEATGILMVDADMEWQVDDVRLLLAEVDKRPEAVVGAFYPSRSDPTRCVGAPLEEKGLTEILDRPAVLAHHLGGGFLFIPRVVLERLGGPEFFPVGYAAGAFRGEDCGFAARCHAAGVELWGMSGLEVGHPLQTGPRTMREWLRSYRTGGGSDGK